MLKAKNNLIFEACDFLTQKQVGDKNLWKKLVDQFRKKTDKTGEYKGEYWGKIMRGAALIYSYTQNEKLYNVLEETVKDILTTIDENGAISSYRCGSEWTGWDIWCRKYVAIGLEYFYGVCHNEDLKKSIVKGLTSHLNVIANRFGNGKENICLASSNWGGLNSCSILLAFVLAYEITGEKKFLDFSEYLVSTGGSKDFNFLKAAQEDVLPLCSYRYPKAYECTSYFEGLLEYGKVTGKKDILAACKNYARSLIKEEMTIVGCGGCAVECFDYSALFQTMPRKHQLQETCVTVSYMLYFDRMYSFTKESVYLDLMEKSFYNAYLGALNQSHPEKTHYLPIDWYSPLVGGKRSNWLVAGRQRFSDGSIYSCCTAMGPAGSGVFATRSYSVDDGVVSFLFYDNKTYDLPDGTITEKTDYPRSGEVRFLYHGKTTEANFRFRIPSWCEHFTLSLNGKTISAERQEGFISVSETINEGDEFIISMEMPYRYLYMASAPFKGGFLSFSKGPIILAADKRYTRIFTSFLLHHQHEPSLDFTYKDFSADAVCGVEVRSGNKKIQLIDYASAGGTYDIRSKVNVFIPYRTGSPRNILDCFISRHRKV